MPSGENEAGAASGAASGAKQKVKLFKEEILIAKRDLLDFVLREVTMVDNFWRYRFRKVVGMGLGISFESSTDIGEVEGGLAVALNIRVYIPEELWIKLAALRKQRRFKLPKPHPVIRQRYREMEMRAEELERELEKEFSSAVEEFEVVEVVGEGAEDIRSRPSSQEAGGGLQGAEHQRAGRPAPGDSEDS